MKKFLGLIVLLFSLQGFSADYSGQDLSGFDFSGQDLSGSNFESAILFETNFTSAYLWMANLSSAMLENANFTYASLAATDFSNAVLTNANFTDAYISGGTNFSNAYGFTRNQLYSTASYKEKNLENVFLMNSDLRAWNFSGQNLSDSDLRSSNLSAANFTDSNITGVNFDSVEGFTKVQLYSTSNYKNKDLNRITLSYLDMSGWDFSGQNLFYTFLSHSNLGGTNFTDANITHASLGDTTNKGFTKEQLYSTASYKNGDLEGLALYDNNITGWDFSNQNLANANFDGSILTKVNFTGADLRGARLSNTSGTAIFKNTIMTDGRIENFSMTSASDSFSIRKYEPASSGGSLISAKLDTSSTISGGAVLTLERGADFEITNNSTLSVAQGSVISINTDASSSTSFSILAGSDLVFENGAILEINLEGTFTADDSVSFVVFDWENGGKFEVIGDFVKGENIFLSLNGEKFDGDWNFKTDGNNFIVNISHVPEPATYAAIFGALTLLLALGKRKAHLVKSGR